MNMLFILKQCHMLTQEGSENRHMIHSSALSASCLLVLLMRNMCSRSKQPMKTKGRIQSLLFAQLTISALQQRQSPATFDIFVLIMLCSYHCESLIHDMLFLVKMHSISAVLCKQLSY